jgi:DNA-binding LytR/AlgR family response regulator
LIRCIIVEDEELAQEVIRRHLQQVPSFTLVGSFRSAAEALPVLEAGDVDLMFLDIRLPGMTGLQLLRSLKDPPLVILTTAYAEYALEGYELNVIDYLLKPISFDRFFKAVDKISSGRLFAQKPADMQRPLADHVFVKSGGKFFKVNFSEIVYIQGMRDYLKICTPDYNLLTLQTMSEMEKTLPAGSFIRVHRSYIVSISRIHSIYGNSIELGKETIPIGVQYRAAVMDLVGKRQGPP